MLETEDGAALWLEDGGNLLLEDDGGTPPVDVNPLDVGREGITLQGMMCVGVHGVWILCASNL